MMHFTKETRLALTLFICALVIIASIAVAGLVNIMAALGSGVALAWAYEAIQEYRHGW